MHIPISNSRMVQRELRQICALKMVKPPSLCVCVCWIDTSTSPLLLDLSRNDTAYSQAHIWLFSAKANKKAWYLEFYFGFSLDHISSEGRNLEIPGGVDLRVYGSGVSMKREGNPHLR